MYLCKLYQRGHPLMVDLYRADAKAGKKGGHDQAQAREKRLGVRDGELNVVGVEAALAVVADTLPRIIPSVLINRREGAHESRSICACLNHPPTPDQVSCFGPRGV